jgi:hypothetical protein
LKGNPINQQTLGLPWKEFDIPAIEHNTGSTAGFKTTGNSEKYEVKS